MSKKIIDIYVKLLEEGTPTIRPTKAISLGEGQYELLAIEGYDPEDEIWELLPGTIVNTNKTETDDGEQILIAIPLLISKQELLSKHPNANIVDVYVVTGHSKRKKIEAINLNNNLYKLLPTDNYNPTKEYWEFSPGAVVRVVKEIIEGQETLLAFDQIREDRMNEDYALRVNI